MTTNEKAAPPPAAARGDVRAVLQEMRDRHVARRFKSQTLIDWADRIEAALAAEGVQAGEVEQRVRRLQLDGGKYEVVCETWGETYALRYGERWRDLTGDHLFAHLLEAALSQQPEARGVVDDRIESILHKLNEWSRAYPEDIFREPSKDEREWLHATKPGLMDRVSASMGRHMVRLIRDDLRALTAALTGERNG